MAVCIINAQKRALRATQKSASDDKIFFEFTMASFAMIVSGVWNFYVTNAIVTGWWISRMNTYNTSLLLAWLVCLCDLVYIIDGFARTTRRFHRSILTLDFTLMIDHRPASSVLELVLCPLKILTFVPYHVLVILDLELSGLYLVVCVLRFLKILSSGRLYFSLTFSNKVNLDDGQLQTAKTTNEPRMRAYEKGKVLETHNGNQSSTI